jgi:polyisoprenoid-binding protein YceI
MSTTQPSVTVPAGTWELDTAHTSVNFSVRHMMVAKVRGSFKSFHGAIVIAEDPLASSVTVVIDTESINTADETRDTHLKSGDFLEAEKYPTLTFASTEVRNAGGDDYEIDGTMTIRDITRPLTLNGTFSGVQKDPWGGTRLGFEANTEFSRKDFGLEWNVALEAGGFVVGDKIKVELEVEAVLKEADK